MAVGFTESICMAEVFNIVAYEFYHDEALLLCRDMCRFTFIFNNRFIGKEVKRHLS